MNTVLNDMHAGRWVPYTSGNKFKVIRLLPDRYRTQEESQERYATLDEAQAECDRRNHGTA